MKRNYGIKTYNDKGELIEPWCNIWVEVEHYIGTTYPSKIIEKTKIVKTEGSSKDYVKEMEEIIDKYFVGDFIKE